MRRRISGREALAEGRIDVKFACFFDTQHSTRGGVGVKRRVDIIVELPTALKVPDLGFQIRLLFFEVLHS